MFINTKAQDVVESEDISLQNQNTHKEKLESIHTHSYLGEVYYSDDSTLGRGKTMVCLEKS